MYVPLGHCNPSGHFFRLCDLHLPEYMAHYQNKDIKDVAEQGPGLVFEVYPEAIATLPGSQIWSILFFFTLIMLGMDSAVSLCP